MASSTNDALVEIGNRAIADGNRFSVEWRKKMLGLVAEVAVASPNTYILDPFALKATPPEQFSALLGNHLLPVVLTSDPMMLYAKLDKLMGEKGIVGMEKYRYYSTPGTGVTYMEEPVLDIFPVREERIDVANTVSADKGTVRYASPKYYLPLVYRLMEEAALSRSSVSSPLFEMEDQWSSQMRGDVHLSLPLSKRGGGMDRPRVPSRPRLSLPSDLKVTLTSGSAALFHMGVSFADLPQPIECVSESLRAWENEVVLALSGEKEGGEKGGEEKGGEKGGEKSSGGRKIEVRQFPINHPSGHWYIRISQIVVDGQLALMCYDSPHFFPCGTSGTMGKSTISITSPFITLAHLCLSSWLMERKGIERYKWVNSVYQKYRRWAMEEGGRKPDQKELYSITGTITEWRTLYYLQ